ncbi:MAG: 50S ribosomal protein L24 [Planctomycetes bacterium]|jgi:large subunit ribosomal protein L24|nr:50S ribosomal protein L24 [Planctomycetota bacterium]
MPQHVKKGDVVLVTSGNHRGSTGEILDVNLKSNRVIVKGVNVRKRRVRPTQAQPKGAIIEKELSIHISNVSPVVGGKATRVRFVSRPDGSKVRVAARDGSELHVLRKSSAGKGTAKR